MSRTEFVVLPDVADARPAAAAAPFEEPRMVAHPSGRPWLIGHWQPGEVLLATAGSVHVAVIGFCPVTAGQLTELAGRVRTVADVDRLSRALPGSFHLVAVVDGRIRIQGSLTGVTRIFHARFEGVTVAADRADVLAAMTRAPVDQDMLATRVACGGMLPPPLGERSMWRGVTALAPDHYLLLDRTRAREVRWWWPPEPGTSLTEGAQAVREALTTALSDRRPDDGRLSSDLSGGMDSTSLAFLAARHTPELLTFRWGEAEAGNDDAFYAASAAQSLPLAEHLVVPQSELPEIFADPAAAADPEQPYPFTRTLARTVHTARLLGEHGSRLHLAGHGGDELFVKFPGYLHRLLRRRPLTGLRHMRGHRALSRWPLAATVGELARPGTAAAWWNEQADHLGEPSVASRHPPLGWGFVPLRAPEWVTGDVLASTRGTLRETAGQVRPFAEDRGQHQFLLALRTTGPAYRQMARLFAAEGVELHMPYFDDRVVEAALAVRLHERATPWRYKPLLADAMRGIVPDIVLDRSTKGEFSRDLHIGWRRHLPQLLELFTDSALAADGLIDPQTLRDRLLAPQADNTRHIAVEHLLGCETWLRAARRPVSLRRTDDPASAP
ncbi:lasso peptide isopeptide bond-forming cyclase [Streptomyces sp. NPDC021096]|uniref:lasso peptide isopeptide bond-forming cyclase n=1 Tax=Streptomyces sp. NPDC021096 TaxID=3154792 RepID=UPI0033C5E95F